MKLGILTFHRALNYGAVLQSYALETALNLHGYEAEIIDYACDYMEKQYRPYYNPSRSLKGIGSALAYYPIRREKSRKFKAFRASYLKLSNKKNLGKNDLKRIAHEYDRLIVGSDQVWNPKLTGGDASFFLDFADSEQKISYAASLGADVPDSDLKPVYKKYLSDYSLLSVREKASEQYLSELLQKPVVTVLDPVFLLNKAQWAAVAGSKPIIQKPYIFVYCLHEKSCYHYAEMLAKEKEIEIVSIPDSLKVKCGGKKDFTAGVCDFLNYICYADYVITDSFHATAFSLIFEKNLNIVLKQSQKSLNGRLSGIAKLLNVSDCVIQGPEDVGKLGIIQDYKKISPRMKEYRDDSYHYIQRMDEKVYENNNTRK